MTRKWKLFLGAWLVLGLGLAWGVPRVDAAAAAPTPTATATAPQPAQEVVLCFPGVYPAGYASDCMPWGPAEKLSRLAAVGYWYPPEPVPGKPLDLAQWFTLPGDWHYAWVRDDGSRNMYPSLEDAVKGTHKRHLRKGFVYVSYSQAAYYQHKLFYLVKDEGWWMNAQDLWAIEPSKFRGVRLTQTPARPFGWLIKPAVTKRTPGFAVSDYTHHRLERYERIQVYATAQANGIDWYLIAPDEWVPQTSVGLVFPKTQPPEGVTGHRWIEVNLFEQTLAVYEQNQLIFATLVSTGHAPFWTSPGVFQIYDKVETTQMRGAFEADKSDYYQLDDVPWTMYYDGTRALHGAYWHDSFGYTTSHGCINLSIADAHWLYVWSRIGDWVYVWDPSGQTPTDGGGGGP